MENIESIRHDGYYSSNDPSTLLPHTHETRALYELGLAQCGDLDSNEYYSGVLFSENQKVIEVETPEKPKYIHFFDN